MLTVIMAVFTHCHSNMSSTARVSQLYTGCFAVGYAAQAVGSDCCGNLKDYSAAEGPQVSAGIITGIRTRGVAHSDFTKQNI